MHCLFARSHRGRSHRELLGFQSAGHATTLQLAPRGYGKSTVLTIARIVYEVLDDRVAVVAVVHGYRRLRMAPGKVAYRNSNYAVLGELVARLGGCPYAQFIEEELLLPLGSAATFHSSGAMAPR